MILAPSHIETVPYSPVANSGSVLILRFDSLFQEILNVKDVIVNICCRESEKVVSHETSVDSLDENGRWNNLEVAGIPISDQGLETKLWKLFNVLISLPQTMILKFVIGLKNHGINQTRKLSYHHFTIGENRMR